MVLFPLPTIGPSEGTCARVTPRTFSVFKTEAYGDLELRWLILSVIFAILFIYSSATGQRIDQVINDSPDFGTYTSLPWFIRAIATG
jgi:hypothetical protein